MRRNFARGSRHRGSGICHDDIRNTALNKAIFAAGMSLALAACATTSREIRHPPDALPSVEIPVQSAPSPTPDMIGRAAPRNGQPYRFGVATPGGLDCSGLVFYAAANAGIRVPRTPAEQLRVGSH